VTAVATVKWTEHSVYAALYRHFARQGWSPLREVSAGSADPFARTRRIDVLMMRPARAMDIGKIELLAVEIKVSKADFRADVANPAKQAPWRKIAHRHVYAAPAGLIDPADLPDGSGLVEVYDTGIVKFAVKGPRAQGRREVPYWLQLAIIRRAAWLEAQTKGVYDGEETVESLRGKVRKIEKDLATLGGQLAAARERADRHRAAAGLLAGLPCRFCGALVRPKISGGRYMSYAWQHTKADEQGCEPLRLAAARERWDALSEEDRHRQGGLFERWALMWHGMDPPGPVEDQEENQ